MISNDENNISVKIEENSSSINIQPKKKNLNSTQPLNDPMDDNIMSDIVTKTKYNNVYEMQRKVDNIQKQVST